jgi:hypothetical protein
METENRGWGVCTKGAGMDTEMPRAEDVVVPIQAEKPLGVWGYVTLLGIVGLLFTLVAYAMAIRGGG